MSPSTEKHLKNLTSFTISVQPLRAVQISNLFQKFRKGILKNSSFKIPYPYKFTRDGSCETDIIIILAIATSAMVRLYIIIISEFRHDHGKRTYIYIYIYIYIYSMLYRTENK